MVRLSHASMTAVLRFVETIHDGHDLNAWPSVVLSALTQLIPSDIVSYNEINPATGRLVWRWEPSDLQFIDATLEEHMAEHPLINHYYRTGDGRSLRISDFLSQRQFHDIGLYQDFFRLLHVDYQMATTLPAPQPLVIGLALSRVQRDFSEQERAMLDLVRPHLIQSYRNAEAIALLLKSEETTGREPILVDRSGCPQLLSERGQEWLKTYFGELASDGLPAILWDWVQAQGGRDSESLSRSPLVVQCESRRLLVRFIGTAMVGRDCLLVLEEEITAVQTESLARLGLTRREREVLTLTARGLTNAEIADALYLSGQHGAKAPREYLCEVRGDITSPGGSPGLGQRERPILT
jgi:hypothetical protein